SSSPSSPFCLLQYLINLRSPTPPHLPLRLPPYGTLYPALPKSTSLSRTLITCRNQHTANSRAEETETSHPVCGQDGGSNDLRINKNYALELYTSQQDHCIKYSFFLGGSPFPSLPSFPSLFPPIPSLSLPVPSPLLLSLPVPFHPLTSLPVPFHPLPFPPFSLPSPHFPPCSLPSPPFPPCSLPSPHFPPCSLPSPPSPSLFPPIPSLPSLFPPLSSLPSLFPHVPITKFFSFPPMPIKTQLPSPQFPLTSISPLQSRHASPLLNTTISSIKLTQFAPLNTTISSSKQHN
ncbi:hypothetical protein FHG87_024953, partial [Trinorchestia longiramus]